MQPASHPASQPAGQPTRQDSQPTRQPASQSGSQPETHEIADLGGDLSPELVQIGASKNADTGGDSVQKTSTNRSISELPFSCSPPRACEVLGIDFSVVLGVNFWTACSAKCVAPSRIL